MMPSFHDVFVFALYAMVFVAVSLVCYIVMSFVQYLVREYKFFKQFIMMVWNWVARTFDFKALLFISFPAVILFFGILPSDTNAPSFIEKQAFLFGVLLGFPVLIKRLSVMQEQVEKSQKQVDIGQEQTRINQYNAANDWLWSNHSGLRMAGIDTLWRVAQTYPQEEYDRVMDSFTHFVKHPLPYEWKKGTKKGDKKAGKRDDISLILWLMGEEQMAEVEPYQINLRDAHLEGAILVGAHLERADLEGAHLEGVNLNGAHLEGATLVGANLEGANLSHARLGGADLIGACLKGAYLEGADLERARLWESHLEGADFSGANLEGALFMLTVINGANFADATGLTQEQIDECVFIKDHPPFKGKPKLPEDIKPNYRKLSLKEWEDEIKMKF